MVDEDELKCERVGRGDGEYKVCAAKVFVRYSVSIQWVCIFLFLCSSMCIHHSGCMDLIHHIRGYSSRCVSLNASKQQTELHGSVYANTCPCVWACLCVSVDDPDSRWVNSQVCPSFSGRIRGRWNWAWLDVSRLMSFLSLTSVATAAAWAKLETGTQSWLTFTRLIYIVPQMYDAIMPCQFRKEFG